MNIEKIAEQIWTALEAGKASLKNSITRSCVDEALRRNQILQNPQNFDERALMKHFFLAFVEGWPHSTNLDNLEGDLKALQEMRLAMNVDEINQHVAVFDDHCQMKDGRQSLVEFKRALTELVLHEWEVSEAGEEK